MITQQWPRNRPSLSPCLPASLPGCPPGWAGTASAKWGFASELLTTPSAAHHGTPAALQGETVSKVSAPPEPAIPVPASGPKSHAVPASNPSKAGHSYMSTPGPEDDTFFLLFVTVSDMPPSFYSPIPCQPRPPRSGLSQS